jgi:3-hydroxymyristoyl/3-hydroxydecanoyl-(acyl carrier protein) dehydratase
MTMRYANPFPMLDGAQVERSDAGCRAVRRIRVDEPYLAGHFPGWPVAPGVLLLQLMREVASQLLPEPAAWELQRMEGLRLLEAVFPETELVAEARPIAPGAFATTLAAGDKVVARCKLYFKQQEVLPP